MDNDKLDLILYKLEKNETDHKELKEELCKVTCAIYGNGKPGLKESFAKLQTNVRLHWFFLSGLLAITLGVAAKGIF